MIGFAKVFGVTIEDLLEPLHLTYQPDLIRLYVNRWVDMAHFVRQADFRSKVVLSNLSQLARRFPQVDAEIRGMIEEKEGRNGAFLSDFLGEYEADLVRSAKRDVEYLDPTEFILFWRAEGKTGPEILEMARLWSIEEPVEQTLKLGVTHFLEADFAGWIPLDFLEIRDGKVTRKASAGRAAEAAAEQAAREAGLHVDEVF